MRKFSYLKVFIFIIIMTVSSFLAAEKITDISLLRQLQKVNTPVKNSIPAKMKSNQNITTPKLEIHCVPPKDNIHIQTPKLQVFCMPDPSGSQFINIDFVTPKIQVICMPVASSGPVRNTSVTTGKLSIFLVAPTELYKTKKPAGFIN